MTSPSSAEFRQAIDNVTAAAENTWLDAEGIARAVFGSQPAANLIVLGIAYQRGLLPVTSAASSQPSPRTGSRST